MVDVKEKSILDRGEEKLKDLRRKHAGCVQITATRLLLWAEKTSDLEEVTENAGSSAECHENMAFHLERGMVSFWRA